MSRDVLKDVKTFTSKPAFFTPHPIYDSYLEAVSKADACARLKLDPAKKYILFFGFIREYKGLDWLLQAMADERIVNAGIELIAAGEYYNKDVEAANNAIIAQPGLRGAAYTYSRNLLLAAGTYYPIRFMTGNSGGAGGQFIAWNFNGGGYTTDGTGEYFHNADTLGL
jgi:glycosyltransferase involved in cell wall biosynthesis